MSIISNIVVIELNNQYEKFYSRDEKIDIVGTIISSKNEKNYYNLYTLKSTNKYIYVYVDKKINLDYGDKVYLKGKYKKPEIQRNYRGFDYSKYLKSKNVYGSIKVKDIEIIEKNNYFKILKKCNEIKIFLKEKINENWNSGEKDILLGIILGENEKIDEEIVESFKISNLSHILAISGMHISYIIISANFVLKKLIGYRKSNYITIFIIILYMIFIGFSPSLVRASIMGILTICSRLLYSKSDTITNISLSAFILLIFNPFIIFDLGFQFSYSGTLGIILFNKTIYKILKSIKNKYNKSLLDNKFGKAISIILSAQIFVFPISILNSGTIGIYFIFTNLLASIIIGPIILIGIIYFFTLIINFKISSIVAFSLKILIKILIFISNINFLPFSKFYLAIPNFFIIVLYFIIIMYVQIRFIIYEYQIPKNQTIQRIRNIIALIRYKIKPKKKILKWMLGLILLFSILYNLIPKDLKIFFIDVGQGDSTFIVTPTNKTILIDGGGQENFDVGKKILLPYILSRGYTSIDYILISHFDTDHIRTEFYLLWKN
ncbi:MAG: ComEC/Rec2 family competence protein [Clostridia bacterium]|nr:ComEC/Rec2 family competence protein [Clostridia bacterium]